MQEVARPLALDERMMALAAAISIDYDYFSQHSHGPGMMPGQHGAACQNGFPERCALLGKTEWYLDLSVCGLLTDLCHHLVALSVHYARRLHYGLQFLIHPEMQKKVTNGT